MKGAIGFPGFPARRNDYVPLPEIFFSELLPQIQSQVELKLTLHLFWLLYHKKGTPRCVSERELEADKLLLKTLAQQGNPRPPEDLLQEGLELVTARGTILRLVLRIDGEPVGWYFFNTERGRRTVARLREGLLPVTRLLEQEATEALRAVGDISVELDRPTIFTLYEQNIALLTPMIAEELKEAADHYPQEWIADAFRMALRQNNRRWSYIRAILERWEVEGKDHGKNRRYHRQTINPKDYRPDVYSDLR